MWLAAMAIALVGCSAHEVIQCICISIAFISLMVIMHNQLQFRPMSALDFSIRIKKRLMRINIRDSRIRDLTIKKVVLDEHDMYLKYYQGPRDGHEWQVVCSLALLGIWGGVIELLRRGRGHQITCILSNIRSAYMSCAFSTITPDHPSWDEAMSMANPMMHRYRFEVMVEEQQDLIRQHPEINQARMEWLQAIEGQEVIEGLYDLVPLPEP